MRTNSEEEQDFFRCIREFAVRWRTRSGAVLAIALAALLGWRLISGSNGITAYQQKRAEAQTLQSEIQKLKQENSQLAEHIQHLQSDPDAIEHEARKSLHYARPGEVIYQLSPGSTTPSK